MSLDTLHVGRYTVCMAYKIVARKMPSHKPADVHGCDSLDDARAWAAQFAIDNFPLADVWIEWNDGSGEIVENVWTCP